METNHTTIKMNTWKRCRESFVNLQFNFDKIFYRIGLSIGNKPWLWLIASLCISGVCGPGMLLWHEEIDEVKLFIPVNSVLRSDAAWVRNHFKDELRYESIIVTAPNVLDPEVIRMIAEIENTVENIVVNNQSWHDVCAGYLTWFENDDSESPDNITLDDDLLVKMIPLKAIISADSCIYQSVLKLWKNNGINDLNLLTKEKILDDITAALHSIKKGDLLTDVAPLLSQIQYNKFGKVIGAKATLLNWMLKKSNKYSPDWESEFIERVLNLNHTLPKGMKIYAIASRSYVDFIQQMMRNNVTILLCGLLLIVIYVTAMIGRCNRVQQRIYLSLMGVSVVGQAILSSYGICFYLGFTYGHIHPILPFLLLGIGVDDMFVIIQSLESLAENKKKLSIPMRIATALQQSGMSITVTSFTNIVAFAIGMTTVMPLLISFCMFATMGILFLYIFELMFFVSCLVLDERRQEITMDGCFRRSKPDWKPNECSQRNMQKQFFLRFIGPVAMKPKIKFIVIFITGLILCINIWGIYNLKQDFDPLLYLNEDSYPIQFHNNLVKYFPRFGKRANIYLSGVDYYEDRDNLAKLINTLKTNPYINNRTLDPWFIAYGEWLKNNTLDIDKDEYYGSLPEYLLTQKGQSYVKDIKFNRLPTVDYNITVSKIQIQHIFINTTTDQLRAMQLVRDTLNSANFSRGIERIALFSRDYVSWVTNKAIGGELIRNLSLEILAVGLVTALLLRDLKVTFWVICCVAFTLIDLLGSMYYFGLTIEISTSIIILLCAGLAVDYAAHVGLEFTRTTGDKEERSIATLGNIGPAVFNGGLSTFLAFVLLGASNSHVFTTFFKLFTSVVVFGLFHGLLFLPVILSIFSSNIKNEAVEEKNDHTVWEQNRYCTLPLSSSTNDSIHK
ncbi:hypothetical protein PV325_008019 [Microctonus aethiopoides]|uniref:SSD domain-containing protein n=1 Tax=Microctonus aethiopoides TaxID=144406 RepID=A0AA39FJ48_9HYME|nr:hypothetical protein PV325_008019 [Microctonus aethiopoides]KAK0170356.1 hypothetical protein PV328_010927 [Microctonus aethiopoides]